MRRYESVVILDPELADEEIVGFTERSSQVIKNHGGEIIKIEDWGPKRLAYLVRKKDRGRFILFDFVGLPALIRELERQFKIADEVMKFLSVKLDEKVDLEAFKATSAEQKDKEAPAPEQAPEVQGQPEEGQASQEGQPAGSIETPEVPMSAAESELSAPQADAIPEGSSLPDTASPASDTAAEGVKEDK